MDVRLAISVTSGVRMRSDMEKLGEAAGVLAALTSKLWGRFDLKDTDVREAVKHTRVPILLIHGEDDDFVPPEMSAELLSYHPTMMERHTFPGASHGISYVIDPERYEKLVTAFAARVMI